MSRASRLPPSVVAAIDGAKIIGVVPGRGPIAASSASGRSSGRWRFTVVERWHGAGVQIQRPMRYLRTVLLAIGIVLTAGHADAKVAITSLAELTKLSDRIVIGKVLEVRQVAGRRVAAVEALRVVKGPADGSVVFVLAEPTWTCDITKAYEGETALFFLNRDQRLTDSRRLRRALDRLRPGAPFFEIAWSGRGRMPLRRVDGVEFVTLWPGDVRLPSAISTIDGPEPEYRSFIRSVRLDDMVREVESQLAAAPEQRSR